MTMYEVMAKRTGMNVEWRSYGSFKDKSKALDLALKISRSGNWATKVIER